MAYNSPYKKGKFNSSNKAKKADFAKTSRHVTYDKNEWLRDTRKYDLAFVDTGPQFAARQSRSSSAYKDYLKQRFKYKFRSKPKTAKSGKRYRRYIY